MILLSTAAFAVVANSELTQNQKRQQKLRSSIFCCQNWKTRNFELAIEHSVKCILAVQIQTSSTMSQNPEERNRDSRKSGDNNIEQGAEPPLNMQGPTEPVLVGSSKDGIGTTSLICDRDRFEG
jgi:hypothetical protein